MTRKASNNQATNLTTSEGKRYKEANEIANDEVRKLLRQNTIDACLYYHLKPMLPAAYQR